MPLSIDTCPEGDGVHLFLRGEIDLATRDDLAKALQAMPPHTDVVVDLTDVTFMDCCGMTPLIDAYQHAHDSGNRFSVVHANGVARLVLAATGVLDVIGEA